MKKILFFVFMALCLLFSMVSCNEPDPSIGNDDVTENGDPSEDGGKNEDGTESDEDEETDNGGSEVIEDGFIYSVNSKKYHLPTCRFVASMKEESKIVFDGTIEELEALGYTPCKTCKPNPDYDYGIKDDESSNNNFIDVDSGYTYAKNPTSMKFHYSGCTAVKNTNAENKVYSNATRSEIVREGYEPCGICNP